MNNQYGGFAKLYDQFMAGTDYKGWVSYIQDIFAKYNTSPKLLLDLGCGTGTATRLFAEKGYDVIGLDNSAEMLSAAKEKDPQGLYIQQDIRSFELYGTVDAVVSLCDVFNYLLTPRDLLRSFKLINNYLNPNGLLIFDINTPHKYKNVLGNRNFARQTKQAAFIWDNRYYPKERINEYRLTFFEKQENGLFKRFRERHLQRAHEPTTINKLLNVSGLTTLGIFGEKTFSPPNPNEQRIFIVAKK